MVDSVSLFKQSVVTANNIAQSPKLSIIEDMWQWLIKIGITNAYANLITFVAAIAALTVIIWFVDFVIVKSAMGVIKKASKKTKTDLDDILIEKKFFSRILQLIPLLLVFSLSRIIFSGFEEWIVLLVRLITISIIILVVLQIIYALLNTWNEYYNRKPQASQVSIKGYIQVAKIILAFIAGILIISTLTQKDPSNLLVGLGATAALFSLVFKDTILGFIASIQLSAQDMVRPGDWIEMPSKGADGNVLDINVNSVKVQNWDNTITMIPIYSMVSESFTNWRGMEQSDGRRFVRHFYINIDSINFVEKEFFERLKANEIVGRNFDQVLTLAKKSSPLATITNLAVYRAHLEIFLREHPKVNDELTLYVRYGTEISEKGVKLELYAFSHDKEAQLFDAVHRSVVEYVLASAKIFDITLFMSPSGLDIRQLKNKN